LSWQIQSQECGQQDSSGRNQANSQHLKDLQQSLLDISSELIDDELTLQLNPAPQMN
jgi:hypothetical protein